MRRGLLAAVAVALPLHLGLSIAGAIDIDRQWPGDVTRDFVGRFQDSLAERRAEGRPFHILDRVVPGDVVPGLFFREARASVLLALYEADAPFSAQGPGEPLFIDDRGELVPGRLKHEASAQLRRARIDAGTVRQRGGAACVTPAPGGRRRSLRIPVAPATGGADHVVLIDYDASAPIRLELSFIRPSGEVVSAFGVAGETVDLPAGTRARYASPLAGRFEVSGLELALDSGEELCLRAIDLRVAVPGR